MSIYLGITLEEPLPSEPDGLLPHPERAACEHSRYSLIRTIYPTLSAHSVISDPAHLLLIVFFTVTL